MEEWNPEAVENAPWQQSGMQKIDNIFLTGSQSGASLRSLRFRDEREVR